MQELFGVLVLENLNGHCQFPMEFLVQQFHKPEAEAFVGGGFDQAVLQGVGEGSVPDVVQQDGHTYCPGLLLCDLVSLGTDDFNGQAHEMHGTYGMLEAGMIGPGIDKVGESQLLNPPQALEQRMFNQVKYQIVWDFDESIHGIIDDFQFVCGGVFPHLDLLCHKSILLLP